MRSGSSVSPFDEHHRLSSLAPGARGIVRRVLGGAERADRLAALGLTPGAPIEVLQTFPGVVLRCDETELAVEPSVAHAILVDLA
jgi:Fe2+ transport system protein FeoA